MADLVTRLRLDNKQFDDNLRSSQQSLKAFESIGSGAKSSIGSLIGTVKGYVGAIGLALTAGEAFNKILRGSQTTSDELDSVMRACSTTVDAFFTSISTGDFSTFDNGINGIIEKAKAANAALDQLGNTVISFDYFSGKNNAEFGEHIANTRDKSLSPEKRKEELEAARQIFNKQEEYTNTLYDTTVDAIRKVATETAGILNADDITYNDVEDVLRLDVSKNRDKDKQALNDKYAELMDIRSGFIKEFTTTTTMQSSAGAFTVGNTDWEKVNEKMRPYISSYKDAILYNEILVKKDDDWLKNLSSNMTKANSGMMALNAMRKQLVRGDNTLNNTTNNNKPNKEIVPDGSIKDLKQKISDLNKKIEIEVDPKKRALLQIEIDKLDKELKDKLEKTRIIKFKLDHPDDPGFVKKEKTSLSNIATKPNLSLPSIKSKDSKILNKNIDSANDYAAALTNCANAVATFNTQKLEDNGEGWTQWSSNLLAAAASTIIGLQSLTMAKGVNSAFDLPFPANLAAAAMVLSTVISLFASIPSFATGGIFESNLTSGDKNIARLNGGEMILNKGQQYNLFKLLDNGTPLGSNGEITFKLRGSDIYGSLNNFNKKISKIK